MCTMNVYIIIIRGMLAFDGCALIRLFELEFVCVQVSMVEKPFIPP